MPRELVVLLDGAGQPAGTTAKDTVHTDNTPLHLAFSCWLFDATGALLITRRAFAKKAWPGVWTNSFCGHPGPGEPIPAAIHRRAVEEIGLDSALIADLRPVLPDFAYRAVDSGGIVENEFCPAWVARLSVPAEEAGLRPSPAEVDSWEWVDPARVITAAQAAPFAFSSWLVEELADPRLRAALGAS